MSRATSARPDATPLDLLELATGLSAITAGVLWLWVYGATANTPELCTSTPTLLSHCSLCYPAAFATLAAFVSGGLMLSRRRKP